MGPVTAGVTYYIKLMQREPGVAGTGTNYVVTLLQDVTAPASPKNPRCASKRANTTLTTAMGPGPRTGCGWLRSALSATGRRAKRRTHRSGQANTYIEIPSLNTSAWYDLWVKAIDYSNNTGQCIGDNSLPGAGAHRHDCPAAQPPGAGPQRYLQYYPERGDVRGRLRTREAT